MITTVTYNPKEAFGIYGKEGKNHYHLNHAHPSIEDILVKLKTLKIPELISLIASYQTEIDYFEQLLGNLHYSDTKRVKAHQAFIEDTEILKLVTTVYNQRVKEYLNGDSQRTSLKSEKRENKKVPQKEKDREAIQENTYGTYFSNTEVLTPYTIKDTQYVTSINDV